MSYPLFYISHPSCLCAPLVTADMYKCVCGCVCVAVVSNVSELLGLDSFQLSEVLTQRSMILRGEEICSPLTVEQVTTHPNPLPPLWLVTRIRQLKSF